MNSECDCACDPDYQLTLTLSDKPNMYKHKDYAERFRNTTSPEVDKLFDHRHERLIYDGVGKPLNTKIKIVRVLDPRKNEDPD